MTDPQALMNAAQADPYALVGWKQPESPGYDLQLPSGQRCLVKKLKMEKIVQMGLMNDLDSFTGTIIPDEKSKKGKGKGAAKAAEDESASQFLELMKDPEAYDRLVGTVEKVIVACVMKPTITAPPAKNADGYEIEPRLPDLVYADVDIDFYDKMAIFGSVFEGLGEMSTFRSGSPDVVGTVAEVTSAPVQAVGPDPV